MKLSIKKLSTIAFAFLLAVGAGAMLGVENKAEVKQAEAATTRRVYLDTTNFASWEDLSASFKFQSWAQSTGDVWTKCTKAADHYYYADIDATIDISGFRFARFDSNGTNKWNEGAWESGDLTKYYYKATGWDTGAWYKPNSQVKGSFDQWQSGIELIDSSFDSNGLQLFNKSITFSKNDEFKIVNDSKWLGYKKAWIADSAKEYLSGTEHVDITQASNIKVLKDCVLEIYSKPLIDEYWIQISSLQEAKVFSEFFLSETGSICNAAGDHKSGLESIWNTQKTKFEAMTVGAKNKFNDDADTTIAGARERYIYLVDKYGLAAWDGAPAASSSSVNIFGLNLGSNSSTAIIVIIAALLTVGLCAGYALYRKKKQA